MIEINCPVCEYKEIKSNICPNCDTDISLTRSLEELPEFEKVKGEGVKLFISALIILWLGMGLTVLSSYIFLQPDVIQPVVIINSSPKVIVPAKPGATTYTVKSGEHLSGIASQFCGKNTSWQVITQVNPQLKGRENYIQVGEVLNIPSCQEEI